jgi:hypothetical protein
MDFEQLLRKYLSGAITEPELEQFQSLLDRVPEYKAELRQTLELRSLLHDDALTLTPPSDLSEHIRIAVSSSFAADALVEQEEQARKRRIFLNPIRLSVGAIAAACIVAGVALSPTLPRGSEIRNADRIASVQGAPAALEAPSVKAPSSARPAEIASQSRMKQDVVVVRAATPSTAETEERIADASDNRASEKVLASGMWMLGHEVPSRAAHGESAEQPASSIAQYKVDGDNVSTTASGSGQVDYAAILTRDPAELLKRNFGHASYNPSFDSTMHRQIEPARSEAKPGETIAMTSNEGRRLTIGVTLGAGQVAETKSPTALMQNSYYLSFSLGGYDRIGIEMGASAFQQESRGNDAYAKRQNSDPLILTSVRPTGGITDGAQYGLIGNTDEIHLGKRTAGIPTGVDEAPTANTPSRGTTEPAKENEPKRIEQQISYGAVFYDRRIEVSRTWDVCGRVTFGGANNAVMGNVRAYAAFTPTEKKNITLTMGVGGATLFNLKNEKGSSINYGIYYGIETGF